MQGLRVAVESPLLAKAILSTPKGNTNNITTPDEPPELQVVLNDVDQDAVDLATMNANTANIEDMTVTKRVAQALLHEESFEVCVLDPFGSPTPFLDAAVARAPHLGLLEICATDVGALYGSRPAVTRRHYHSRLSEPRPPCYRERGVRLLVAAVAQAAGRHDRGVVPIFGVSTEHFVLVSLQVVRGARGADTAAQQVQPVRICRTCGAAGIGESVPQCGCESKDGAGTDAREEGPLWVGPLYDADAVQEMTNIASLEEADGLVSKDTRTLLATIQEEASVNGMFYRRPGFAAEGKTPKLAKVMEELKKRGYAVSRTHFDSKALRTDAPVGEFDSAVKAVLALTPGDGDGADYRVLI
jgi:tRNA (guanine26-N2/guanine27-N2)-dimethyltransferase